MSRSSGAPPSEDVPGQEHVVVALPLRGGGQVRPVAGRDDPDQRVDVHHPRRRRHLADRPRPGDGGPTQGQAQPEARPAVCAEGRHPAPLAPGEREEGDLVDRGEEVRPPNPRHDVLGGRTAVARELLAEVRRERVDGIRVAVVEEVPDRQDPIPVHRRDHRVDGREVVPAALAPLHHGPRDTLPRHGDAEPPQEGVVLLHPRAVLCLGHQVAPAPVLPAEGGALEAREEERGKDARPLGHRFASYVCCRPANARRAPALTRSPGARDAPPPGRRTARPPTLPRPTRHRTHCEPRRCARWSLPAARSPISCASQAGRPDTRGCHALSAMRVAKRASKRMAKARKCRPASVCGKRS
jgi:hypothetical protein